MNESHHNVTGWALSLWEIQGNDNILDIGCGGGAALSRMAEHVTDGQFTDTVQVEVNKLLRQYLEDYKEVYQYRYWRRRFRQD